METRIYLQVVILFKIYILNKSIPSERTKGKTKQNKTERYLKKAKK